MLLLLAGCLPLEIDFPGESGTIDGRPALQVELDEASIVAWLGTPRRVGFVVENVGDAAAEVQVEVEEVGVDGWTARPTSLNLAAGASADGEIELNAGTWGDASVTLRVVDQLGGSDMATLSAWVMEDADGDGHASEESGGDDCDDSAAAAHPGAEEVWYDDIDEDCLGGDDQDQDGDGAAVDVDCDDEDPGVVEATEEVWNGLDDDCDGTVDDLVTSSLDGPWIAGNVSEAGVGSLGAWYGGEGLFGSVGDGTLLWRVEAGHGGVDLTTSAAGSIVAPSSSEFSGMSPHEVDGTVLVVAAGRGEAWSIPLASVVGERDVSDVADWVVGGARVGAADLGDVDGDGIADVALGLPTEDWVGEEEEGEEEPIVSVGRAVLVFGPIDDAPDPDDADEETWGGGEVDLLGTTVAVSDVDADGYGDVLLGEPGDDAGATQAGALYLLLGKPNPNWKVSAQATSSAHVVGDSYGASVGERIPGDPTDVDGDGAPDLLVPAPSAGAVAWFADMGDVSGAVALSDADQLWTGDVGLGAGAVQTRIGGEGSVVFGSSAAGAGGTVSVYGWDGSGFVERGLVSGAAGDGLGAGVLLADDALLLGATGDDSRAADGGAWWWVALD